MVSAGLRNFSTVPPEYLRVKMLHSAVNPRPGHARTINCKEMRMKFQRVRKPSLWRSGLMLAIFASGALAAVGQRNRTPLVLTSTNDPSGNALVVFRRNSGASPSLSWSETLRTGGQGGASTNAGILQFRDD